MMFTNAKGVQAHLIRRAHSKTAVVESACEAVNPNLHLGTSVLACLLSALCLFLSQRFQRSAPGR